MNVSRSRLCQPTPASVPDLCVCEGPEIRQCDRCPLVIPQGTLTTHPPEWGRASTSPTTYLRTAAMTTLMSASEPAPSAQPGLALDVLEGPARGARILLHHAGLRLGRSEVPLAGYPADPEISR